jgi:hypothetical protein
MTRFFLCGSSAHTINNAKIFGGSIEGFSSVAKFVVHLSVFGTYFETGGPISGALAFDSLCSSGSLNLYGCVIYLNGVGRFVNASGLTNFSLVSSGNTFVGYDPSAAGCIIFYPPSTGSVHLHGDGVSPTLQDSIAYVANSNEALLWDIGYGLPARGKEVSGGPENRSSRSSQETGVYAAVTSDPVQGSCRLAGTRERAVFGTSSKLI